MMKNFVQGAVSRLYLQPRASYQAVENIESDEQVLYMDKESSTAPAVRWQQIRVRAFVCGFIIFTFLAAIFGSINSLKEWRKRHESFVPTFGSYAVTFDLQELFASPPSETSNAAWDSLIPDGHGYVLIPDAAERYGLEPGISTDEGADRYSISVYHQLHCLGMIRILFYEMVAVGNHTIPHRFYHGTDKDNHDPTPFPAHVSHCFDYIRQSLMCSGDMTVEHSREPPLGEKRADTDGWGVEHKCKDWNELTGWTLAHKAKHALSGILR